MTPVQNFYKEAMQVLEQADIPFLLGGAFAFGVYTGIHRDTKDFDLMMRERDVDKAIQAFHQKGFQAGMVFSHWLAKVHLGSHFVDIIFSSGNGLCRVDDTWFEFARTAELWNTRIALCPPEEMIWQKAFIMERERYDGADVAHLIAHCGESLDWERLEARFSTDWRILLTHLLLFGYVYPSKKSLIPEALLQRLLARVPRETNGENTCCGTFLSRAQYLDDVERRGLTDPRTAMRCGMTDAQIRAWTEAIQTGS